MRKYNVNEKFFNSWSHEMAYILGFISADGNVHGYSLRIELQATDVEILNFVKETVLSENPIKDTIKKGHKYKKLSINSISILNALKNFNIVPNKSKTIRANFEIPSEFLGDYIRGVFDGDGWVYLRRNSIESGICSANKNFLNDLRLKIAPNDSKFNRIRKRTKITKSGKISYVWQWDLGKTASLKLKDLMYQNEQFALKRKRDLFFSDFYVPSDRLWTVKQINHLVANFKPKTKGLLNLLANQLGKTRSAVSKKIWELGLVP